MKRSWTLALILLATLALRVLQDRLTGDASKAVPLRKPLAELPIDLFGPAWAGDIQELTDGVRRIAGVSEYVHRFYRHVGAVAGTDRPLSDSTFWFYVGYVDRWRPDAIHHPRDCFPAIGQQLLAETVVRIPVPGQDEPLRFNESHWSSESGERTYTLYTFLHGKTAEPDEWRLRAGPLSGIRSFAVFILSGTYVPSAGATPTEAGIGSPGSSGADRSPDRAARHDPSRDSDIETVAGSAGVTPEVLEETRALYFDLAGRAWAELGNHLPR